MITTNIYDESYDGVNGIHMTRKILPQNQSVTSINTGVSTSSNYIHTPNIQTQFKPTVTALATTLQELLDSKFEFHLGGSRAMLKRGAQISINDDNDYDFYATYVPEIVSFLNDHHFRLADDYYIRDTECICVYIKETVKIALRKDAKFYRKVFENIPIDLYVKHLWRRTPKCKIDMITPLFDEMFRLAHERESQNSPKLLNTEP